MLIAKQNVHYAVFYTDHNEPKVLKNIGLLTDSSNNMMTTLTRGNVCVSSHLRRSEGLRFVAKQNLATAKFHSGNMVSSPTLTAVMPFAVVNSGSEQFVDLLLDNGNMVHVPPESKSASFFRMQYVQHDTTNCVYAIPLPAPKAVTLNSQKDVVKFCQEVDGSCPASALQIMLARLVLAKTQAFQVRVDSTVFNKDTLNVLGCPDNMSGLNFNQRI